MKLCHVITRMIVGGAQENTLYTCRGHLEKGHEVTLVTGPSPGPEGKLLERTCPPGLRIVLLPDLVREISPWHDWKTYRALRKLFREEHFDVVHTHASKAGILGRIAAWKEHVPFVVHTVHGNAFGPFASRLQNFLYIHLERMAAKRCHKIFTVAQAMIEQGINANIAPRGKYKVVYSGMDLDAFASAKPDAELRSKLGIPEGAPVVGTIARLFALKGHDVLLNAAPLILKAVPETRFLLVGDGILRGELEAQARALGIADRVVFAGLVDPSEVCRYTALMTVLAHLSLREGLPRAAVQALAARVPVVAYPLDGTPEVVLPEKTGLLVPPEDVQAVADAVIRLLKEPSLRAQMGETGQHFVLERFDWHTMADILEEEYKNGTAS